MSTTGPIEHVIIAFDTTNPAFTEPIDGNPDDYYASLEVGVVLNRVMRRMHEGSGLSAIEDMRILDSNGNTIGVVTLTRGKP